MKNIKPMYWIFFALFLGGCSAVQPIKNQVSDIPGKTVTYVFNNNEKGSSLIFGDYLISHHGDGWLENWGIQSKHSGDELLVTKFIDNGTAGSVNEYFVKVTDKGSTVELVPYRNRMHQDGLVLPKPIPKFSVEDINKFLSSTRHEISFELDSSYSSEPTNANFKRILTQKPLNSFSSSDEKIFENSYFLTVEGAEARIDVKTYPYRNGSKCTVKVTYYTQATDTGEIILSEIERKIKKKVSEIVNS